MKFDKLYYRIGKVAELVGVEPHVLRFWETEFGLLRPQKSRRGQRVYSRRDVQLCVDIKHLLYVEGFTLAGANRRLRKIDLEHPHLVNGEFQSDKYPLAPRGKVPLSCADPEAQDLLWEYAQRHRKIDPQFTVDLEIALQNKGYKPAEEPKPFLGFVPVEDPVTGERIYKRVASKVVG